MALLGSTRKYIDKNQNAEKVPKLDMVEGMLMHCNIVNNNSQQQPKVLLKFVPNNQFGPLITISSDTLKMLKTNSYNFNLLQKIWFKLIDFWFNDQNKRPFEEQVKTNIILILDIRQ